MTVEVPGNGAFASNVIVMVILAQKCVLEVKVGMNLKNSAVIKAV